MCAQCQRQLHSIQKTVSQKNGIIYMNLCKISVKKLFGLFDHEIPIKEIGGVTIIIGENGLGKTVILEAIRAFFNKNYRFFNEISFSEFEFEFDNEEKWLVKKNLTGKKTVLSIVTSKYASDKKAYKNAEIVISEERNDYDYEGMIEARHHRRKLEMMKSIHPLEFEKIAYMERMEAEDMFNYRDMFESKRRSHSKTQELPDWFINASSEFNVKLIETQRIITAKERGGDAYIKTVQKSSDELISTIKQKIGKSTEITNKLDKTYPNRLVTQLKAGVKISLEKLNSSFTELNNKKSILSDAGLIDQLEDAFLIEENDEQLITPLELYIDDSNKKLEPFDDVAKNIILFKDIINKRFRHKELLINKEKGFLFQSTVPTENDEKPKTIPASKLSSGEQHELILFYELIFNSKDGDIILIDEPELSLHVSWQNEFITDLKRVTSINKVTVIIATHSPDIINENWSLRVTLKGIQ